MVVHAIGAPCGNVRGGDTIITNADESSDVTCTRCDPSLHPLQLGQDFCGGNVIAWGYFTDEILSVMLLLSPPLRVANERNYAIGHVHLNEVGEIPEGVEQLHDVRHHANIIPAVEDDWRQNEQDY